MSDTERSTIAHKARTLADKLDDGARSERVQCADYMVGFYRQVAAEAIAELQRVSCAR